MADKYLHDEWDGSFVPDYVSPSSEGYFRLPHIWLSHDRPSEDEVRDDGQRYSLAVSSVLDCGIVAQALRAGYFIFDFANFSGAPQVVIPGFSCPDGAYIPPAESQLARQRAEQAHVKRVKIMNAHQLLFSSSEVELTRTSAMMGFPLPPYEAVTGINGQISLALRSAEQPRSVLASFLAGRLSADPSYFRDPRIIVPEVAARSFELLDKTISSFDGFVDILDEVLWASDANRSGRFGPAIVGHWTAAEQMLERIWQQMLASQEVAGRRKAKLNTREYTASVKIEILFMQDVIGEEIYRCLEVARKARNSWAHQMKSPSEADIHCAQVAVQMLVNKLTAIDIHFTSGSWIGTAEWPLKMDPAATAAFLQKRTSLE